VSARSIDELPEPIARAIRMASAPADLRALFAHLPVVVRVDATVSAATPLALRQLLKLASLGGRLEIGALSVGEAPSATAACGERRVLLDGASGDIHALVRRALEALLEPASSVRALETFATRSARLGALQTLTRHMLETGDLTQAQRVLLSGITSGAGLAFNRAALFVRDGATGAFAGARAIGPSDEREAHRIWEEIEYADKSFEEQLADSARMRIDTRLEALVRELSLADGTPAASSQRGQHKNADRDEVSAALEGSGPVLFQREVAVNAGLRALGVSGEFALAPIRPRGEARAILFVDNAFTRARIDGEQLEFLGFFLDQVALVWDNLSLLAENERLARFDSLTGVFNRRGFDERYAEELSRAARLHEPCALLVFDVDEFKAVNDARGHEEGDRVLQRVAALLRSGTREHDIAVRLGGDEFALFLPETTKEEAKAVAERVGAAARRDGISLSAGGACWPDDCVDPSRVMALADEQLYAAKRAGRCRGCFAGGDSIAFAR
jgi:diguanylate cyclase (GGDEF)-like protein